MQDTYLQNEPMTGSIAAPVEKKCSHKMLQTNWIILYLYIELKDHMHFKADLTLFREPLDESVRIGQFSSRFSQRFPLAELHRTNQLIS